MNDNKRKESAEESVSEYGRSEFLYRYIIIAVSFALICIIYIVSALRIQHLYGGKQNDVEEEYNTRTVSISAVRGEIYDRNGVLLVSNEYNYYLIYDYSAMSPKKTEQNEGILAILAALKKGECKIENQFPMKGTYPNLTYDVDMLGNSTLKARLERILSDYGLEEDGLASDLAKKIAARYAMLNDDGSPIYSPEEMTDLIRVRYEMEAIRFSAVEPYVFAEFLDMTAMTAVREIAVRGTQIKIDYSRVYHFPGYASHILGRISGILAEDAEYYSAQGYPLTAKVGISGCELAFEQYLRGMEGQMKITEDDNGNMVKSEMIKEPIAGNDIYLTIDIYLQMASEDALADNIQYIVDRSQTLEGNLDGEDCDSGAIVVQSAKGGEILAIGSYPTYNLATFNKDFADLVQDPRGVYTNRALMGQYRLGSTAKIGMSVAALAEPLYLSDGTLFKSSTKLETKGIYTFYDDYQPECWLYTDYKSSHGAINVSRAISVSCNYFYYELGRIMGIDKINKYFSIFGMGQPTGIELNENLGILADAAYKQTLDIPISDKAWMPGDTLRTSIGVGYSEHTPIQISNYISMIVNGGTRYSAHLLSEVRSFTGEVIYRSEPEILAEIEIADSSYDAIVEGMHGVLSSSTDLKKAFGDFPAEIGAGGKTGTAQTSSAASNNAVFVAFAPLNDPEIVVTCVIERGANGYNASWAAREVLDRYFGLTKDTENTTKAQ